MKAAVVESLGKFDGDDGDDSTTWGVVCSSGKSGTNGSCK